MLFQFRNSYDKVVEGNWTYRDETGQVHYGTEFKIVARRKFHNYPIDWAIALQDLNTKFRVEPTFDDQVITGFWEGLCDVSRKVGTLQLNGQAFVELTGY